MTLICLLIGHKYIGTFEWEDKKGNVWASKKTINVCVRCGTPRDPR